MRVDLREVSGRFVRLAIAAAGTVVRPARLVLSRLVAVLGLTAVPWLAVTPAPAAAAPVERLGIVDRAIEHHGGELYRRSETALEICSKSGCAAVRARLDGGLYDFEVRARVRGAERRVRSTNDGVEWWEAGERRPVPPERRQALRDWVMERVYFAFLPFRLNDPGVYKEDLGLEAWEGRELHKVKVTFAPGSSTDADDEYLFWFDPSSGRLEQFAYSYTRGEGGLRLRRGFDYRRVGGLLFFDQRNYGVDGAGLSVDLVGPRYVEREMRLVSTVELRDIRVEPLPGPRR